jgi:hypothetical protein
MPLFQTDPAHRTIGSLVSAVWLSFNETPPRFMERSFLQTPPPPRNLLNSPFASLKARV